LTRLLDTVLVPIHPDGWPFIGGAAAAALLLGAVNLPLGVAGAITTAFCAWFFRNPDRVTPVRPGRPGLIVSPADGLIVAVGAITPPPDLLQDLDLPPGPLLRISIFLSIFDVHVNRAPVDGTIVRSSHRPGRFENAIHERASAANERRATLILTDGGVQVGLVQIAGLIARRIVFSAREGVAIRAGERLGLIRFGSRVDVLLPPGTPPLVAIGQRSIGGETVLADLDGAEPPRSGERR
jgi:phosphatidylserine decarboxylase